MPIGLDINNFYWQGSVNYGNQYDIGAPGPNLRIVHGGYDFQSIQKCYNLISN